MFVFLKTRSSDGVGKTVLLKWDGGRLRISNLPKDESIDDDGVITSRLQEMKANKQAGKAKSLLDSFMVDSEQ